MKKPFKYMIVALLLILLVLVRAFEDVLFYDPFINFFKGEYTKIEKPLFNGFILFANHFLRYLINTVISMAIIYIFFKDMSVIKVVTILYALFFVLLILAYFYFINYKLEDYYLITFYTRRFLIQPLFLFIFIPAFYYQKRLQQAVNESLNKIK